MYKAYKLELNSINYSASQLRYLRTYAGQNTDLQLLNEGSIVESNHPKFSIDDLHKCMKGQYLDIDKLKDSLFPTNTKYHVFISHSSNDIDKIKKLVGLLKSKDLNVFVDSFYWGNVYEVLNAYDKKHSRSINPQLLSYEKVKYSTRSLYTMLTTCLNCVIDQTDCFLFVQSDNSLFKIDQRSYTESSWIYEELHFASLVRRRTSLDLGSLTPINESVTRTFSKATFAFSIDHFIEDMETISYSDLARTIDSGDEYLINLFNRST